jgi:hypothetical protein
MLIRRIGGFFILIGAGLLLIFIASLQTGAREGLGFMLAGLSGIVIGVLLISRAPKPPRSAANRFRMLRRSHEEDEASDIDE